VADVFALNLRRVGVESFAVGDISEWDPKLSMYEAIGNLSLGWLEHLTRRLDHLSLCLWYINRG
jgi:hypothetical protein